MARCRTRTSGFRTHPYGYPQLMAADLRRRQWRAVGVLAAVAVLVLGVMGLLALIPNLNPFRTNEVDRSQPVLLQSVRREKASD